MCALESDDRSPHTSCVPNLGRRSPGSGSLRKSLDRARKVLAAVYQRLITLFTAWHGPCNRRRKKVFESSKHTNCFSLIGGTQTMKPSQNTRTGAQKFPLVEYRYHKPILNPSSAPCVTRSNSLRDISRDYFDAESKREFVTEAAVAGTLIIMAIMPIMAGVFAVAHLLRVLPLF